jgi:hypothetical protein
MIHVPIGRQAPKAAVAVHRSIRPRSTHSCRSLPSIAMPAHAPQPTFAGRGGLNHRAGLLAHIGLRSCAWFWQLRVGFPRIWQSVDLRVEPCRARPDVVGEEPAGLAGNRGGHPVRPMLPGQWRHRRVRSLDLLLKVFQCARNARAIRGRATRSISPRLFAKSPSFLSRLRPVIPSRTLQRDLHYRTPIAALDVALWFELSRCAPSDKKRSTSLRVENEVGYGEESSEPATGCSCRILCF